METEQEQTLTWYVWAWDSEQLVGIRANDPRGLVPGMHDITVYTFTDRNTAILFAGSLAAGLRYRYDPDASIGRGGTTDD